MLLLIIAKSDGKGKLELGKTFNYGHVTKLEYEDIDSSSIIIDVSSSIGSRRLRLNKGNLVKNCCNPNSLRKDIQTKNNLLVAPRPYVTGEIMSGEAQKPPKKSRKTIPIPKKYNKRPRPDEDEDEEKKSTKWMSWLQVVNYRPVY